MHGVLSDQRRPLGVISGAPELELQVDVMDLVGQFVDLIHEIRKVRVRLEPDQGRPFN